MNGQYIRSIQLHWDRLQEDSYVRHIPALEQLHTLVFSRAVTCFSGENGAGKSTLLEAIATAAGFNPEGGSRNFCFSTRDTHAALWKAMTLVKGSVRPRDGFFLRAESYYNVASQIDVYSGGEEDPDLDFLHSYGGKSLHQQSHGESVLSVVQNRFRGNGLYLLDEPETGLSPQRQLSLLLCLQRLAQQQNSQIIMATHSPILLGMPDAEILSFDSGSVRPILYEETDSYQITHLFLKDRRALLHRLLEE